MNKQEAIKTLREWRGRMADHGVPDFGEKYKALGMAIEALSAERTGWIPVSEKLPEKNGDYIVSLEDSTYPWGRFFNGKWYMLPRGGVAVEFGANEVIAWQPLPEPYESED